MGNLGKYDADCIALTREFQERVGLPGFPRDGDRSIVWLVYTNGGFYATNLHDGEQPSRLAVAPVGKVLITELVAALQKSIALRLLDQDDRRAWAQQVWDCVAAHGQVIVLSHSG